MKTRHPVLIWVDPGFKRRIKTMAVAEDKTLLEFTRRLADVPIIDSKEKKEKKISDIFKI